MKFLGPFFSDKTICFQVYAVMDFEDFDRMFSAYQKKEVVYGQTFSEILN